MNKTAINKLLVAERKSMRTKLAQSAFFRKSASIYHGMRMRCKKERGSDTLPFSLSDLRELMTCDLGEGCRYCKERLSLKNVAVDHQLPIARGGDFGLNNIVLTCKPCNFQKGIMTQHEFMELLELLNLMEAKPRADIKRRLTIGGRWAKAYGAK
jgi:hypothetical protein